MGRCETYAYNLFGDITSKTDKNNVSFAYSYSPEGYMLSETASKDDVTETISYSYDVLGNPVLVTSPTGTVNYTYDGFGRLTSESFDDIIKTYTYDALGNRTAVTITDNGAVQMSGSYVYDKLNRISSITADGITESYTYDENSRPLTISTADTLSEYTYNKAGSVTGLVNKLNSQTVEEYAYSYDLTGNQTQKVRTVNGESDITSYTYDAVNRLKTVTEPDGSTVSYDFDKNGNIMTKSMTHPEDYVFSYSENGTEHSMTDISLHKILYVYNKNNELVQEQNRVAGTGDNFNGLKQSVTDYVYDLNGNTLSKTNDVNTEVYTYDMHNRLATYTSPQNVTTSYTYYADGMRKTKQTGENTEYFVWDNGYTVMEKTNGAVTARNYAGINGIFARNTADGITYLSKNAHGDVTLSIKNSAVVNVYDYDAYGVEKNPNSNDTNSFRYCGEYFDDETGNIYLRNRYYNPNIGRFVTEDPIKDGLNWYVYCNSNPIRYLDVSGLAPGDRFYTMDDAAIDFANTYNEWSIKVDAEYAAYIYSYTEESVSLIDGEEVVTENTYYSYTNPITSWKYNFVDIDNPKEIDIIQTGHENVQGVSVVHTHGSIRNNIQEPYFGELVKEKGKKFIREKALFDSIFSGQDRRMAIEYGIIVYLVTPIGTVKSFDGNNLFDKDRTINHFVPSDPYVKDDYRFLNLY